jgi:hypothetical protein
MCAPITWRSHASSRVLESRPKARSAICVVLRRERYEESAFNTRKHSRFRSFVGRAIRTASRAYWHYPVSRAYLAARRYAPLSCPRSSVPEDARLICPATEKFMRRLPSRDVWRRRFGRNSDRTRTPAWIGRDRRRTAARPGGIVAQKATKNPASRQRPGPKSNSGRPTFVPGSTGLRIVTSTVKPTAAGRSPLVPSGIVRGPWAGGARCRRSGRNIPDVAGQRTLMPANDRWGDPGR